MPSGKPSEETWTAGKLEKALKESRDDKRRPKDRDRDKEKRRERHRGEEEGEKRRRRKEDDDGHRERRHRDKENGDGEKREKHRDKDRHREDRDSERDKHRSSRHRNDDDDDRKRREDRKKKRDEADDSERHHRRHRSDHNEDDESNEHGRRHRRHRDDHHKDDEDDEDDERQRRHQNRRERSETHENEDDHHRERRHHRRPRDDHYDEDKEKRREEKRRHRDEDDDREKRRDERRKHRGDETEEERRIRKEKQRDERRKARDNEESSRERRHHKRDENDDDRERRHRREKEKKPREDDDEDRRRREERKERKRKEKEEEERRKKAELEQAEKRKKKDADEDDYNYDDDFEVAKDYEDDFEDDNDDDDNDDDDEMTNYSSKPKKKFNDEMEEILQAMNDENDRLMKQAERGNWSDSTESEDALKSKRSNAGTQRTFINFVSAKQRQISSKAASKTRQRGIELLQMIELDAVEFDVFDLQPISEYEMYIRSFGGSNTKQAYVQTNDDNLEREIQTEDIISYDKWTQHPSDDILSSGGDSEKKEDLDEKPIDSLRLSKFLEKAGQVIAILLEENFADSHQSDSSQRQSNFCVSESYNELGSVPYLEGRYAYSLHFSPLHNHTLAAAYSSKEAFDPDDPLGKKGLVCVWNVNDPSQPQSLLTCESQPRCVCFAPTKTSLVFSGMSDGSLVAWDLREPSSMHRLLEVKGHECQPRYPSYNTAGVLHYENHQSAIVSVVTISSGDDFSSTGSNGLNTDSEGLSFQLATLEENSVIFLWVVAELSHADLSGSESDLGLAPGSKVKLVKSSVIILDSPLRDTRLRTTIRSLDLQLLPSNNSHFYVATDSGCIVHGVRYGGRAPPKAYRPETETIIEVTSIDFSPFPEPVFLAGFRDGSIRLYHINTDLPLMVWQESTEGHSVQLVRWCRSRPSVFFVLDSRAMFYIWDLTMDDACPLKCEQIAQTSVSSLSLSNDHAATGLGTSGRRPQMAVALSNGRTEIHSISQQFSALMSEEVDQFAQFLQKAA